MGIITPNWRFLNFAIVKIPIEDEFVPKITIFLLYSKSLWVERKNARGECGKYNMHFLKILQDRQLFPSPFLPAGKFLAQQHYI